MTHYDTIIIGAGPAGLTAGIYLSRAKQKVLILDTGIAGGQMVLTHEIANYPGYDSIGGYMLSMKMKEQAEKFGCEIKTNVTFDAFTLSDDTKQIALKDGEHYQAKSVILTTGGRSRKLGVVGEDALSGRGISYCATCDGDFFRDKEIIVVGGGNTAIEEAVSLTAYASKVTVVHMLDTFQAFEAAVVDAKKNPKIDFLMESRITGFKGGNSLEYATIENLKSGEIYDKKIDGTFIFIGYVPNSEPLKGIVEINDWGEVVVDDQYQTDIKGVFAGGDLIPKRFRQITTAVADGTNAALFALEYNHQ